MISVRAYTVASDFRRREDTARQSFMGWRHIVLKDKAAGFAHEKLGLHISRQLETTDPPKQTIPSIS